MSSKRPSDSTRPKRAVRRSRHKRPPEVRSLSNILHDFLEGLSLVRCAHAAMLKADLYGPEEVTIRTGLEALQRVYEQLEEADRSLHTRRGGKS